MTSSMHLKSDNEKIESCTAYEQCGVFFRTKDNQYPWLVL